MRTFHAQLMPDDKIELGKAGFKEENEVVGMNW